MKVSHVEFSDSVGLIECGMLQKHEHMIAHVGLYGLKDHRYSRGPNVCGVKHNKLFFVYPLTA